MIDVRVFMNSLEEDGRFALDVLNRRTKRVYCLASHRPYGYGRQLGGAT